MATDVREQGWGVEVLEVRQSFQKLQMKFLSSRRKSSMLQNNKHSPHFNFDTKTFNLNFQLTF